MNAMLDKVLLFPYYWTLKARNAMYDRGLKKSRPAEVPTICVGNVTVGGTGKTPHTEMILRMLLESDEWGAKNLAVLSRGYKRESTGFQQVIREGSASMFGDEPLQIKKKFPTVTVAVNKDRIEGCDYLCHPEKLQGKKRSARKCWNKEFPASDLIILDDAFQYRKLKASLNIVLVDYYRPVYKDHLLPIGSLRDLPERIGDADVIIVTKCPYELDGWEKTKMAQSLGLRNYQSSDCSGVNSKGRRQTLLFTYIKYDQLMPVFEVSDSRYIYSKRMILFTGIAKNVSLRNHLSDYYKIVRKFSFSDHHRYKWADFHRIQTAVNRWPTAALATTEKDAQRVLDYNGMPLALKERMFMIPIKVDFLSDAEREIFRGILTSVR